MTTATEHMRDKMEREHDERSLRATMARVTERWAPEGDYKKGEFHGDMLMLVQAVNRDAMRETHQLLKNALGAMPSPAFLMRAKEIDAALRAPFRAADDRDWEQLFEMLPDSGCGRFWKAVMTEMRDVIRARGGE